MAGEFQRAHSAEQRAQRREEIVAATMAMLADTRVEELTLTALSERVGLAKSNVLRYFESLHAVLVEVHHRDYHDWLDALDAELPPGPDADVDEVAAIFAESVMSRKRMCELEAYVPIVAEQYLSAAAAAAHKEQVQANAFRLTSIVGSRFGGYDPGSALVFVAALQAGMAGVWSVTNPAPGLASAYAANPSLAVHSAFMPYILREFVATIVTGLAHRTPDFPNLGAPPPPAN